jgi:hypothetical protein
MLSAQFDDVGGPLPAGPAAMMPLADLARCVWLPKPIFSQGLANKIIRNIQNSREEIPNSKIFSI